MHIIKIYEDTILYLFKICINIRLNTIKKQLSGTVICVTETLVPLVECDGRYSNTNV